MKGTINEYVSGGGKHQRQKTWGKEQGQRTAMELVFHGELSGKASGRG